MFAMLEEHRKVVIGVVLGVFAVALIWSIFNYGSGGGQMIDARIECVCVATGETFRMDRNKMNAYPAENPNTGERTLVPCETREDKKLYVVPRFKSLLELELLKEKNRYVDPETLLVAKRD